MLNELLSEETIELKLINPKKSLVKKKKVECEKSRQWKGYLGCVKHKMCKVYKRDVYP